VWRGARGVERERWARSARGTGAERYLQLMSILTTKHGTNTIYTMYTAGGFAYVTYRHIFTKLFTVFGADITRGRISAGRVPRARCYDSAMSPLFRGNTELVRDRESPSLLAVSGSKPGISALE